MRWAAPELLSEEAQTKTTQTDVYALGMTMLETFTGGFPFPDRTDINVIFAVVGGALPIRPKELGSGQKGDLMWQLLLDCWNRNPNKRPSAAQVVKAHMQGMITLNVQGHHWDGSELQLKELNLPKILINDMYAPIRKLYIPAMCDSISISLLPFVMTAGRDRQRVKYQTEGIDVGMATVSPNLACSENKNGLVFRITVDRRDMA
ncbi:unnamed protein product [Rhizoctonia solani]|uniref:Protein kinase domain-containing protein n=1 Tax=Rhizoctonia solani TaxID=456999 RepID=A0A8H3E7T2_9AGAM|nr:unnamed protein product [Rhizoctonia solani]